VRAVGRPRARRCCVIERHARAGLESSTHNSGVIHAGPLPSAYSLKTRLLPRRAERGCMPSARNSACRTSAVENSSSPARDDEASLNDLYAAPRQTVARIDEVSLAFVRDREPHVAPRRARHGRPRLAGWTPMLTSSAWPPSWSGTAASCLRGHPVLEVNLRSGRVRGDHAERDD
jgi:hypothetical protein